ncbi:MAG: hypothetical protein CVT98_04565, partial [Bacteroidetes bacterium HGW-Bacteroidetes-15]
ITVTKIVDIINGKKPKSPLIGDQVELLKIPIKEFSCNKGIDFTTKPSPIMSGSNSTNQMATCIQPLDNESINFRIYIIVDYWFW